MEKYLTDYPEHAQALVACSIELMVDATRSAETVATSEKAVDRAWQRFQSAVSQPEEASVINPFGTLNPVAFKLLAKKLNINSLLLSRLRDRAIVAATIPRRFVQRIATELGATTDAVMDYLRSPPAMVSGHSYRSTAKPAVTEQISFEKAVETSQLWLDKNFDAKNPRTAIKEIPAGVIKANNALWFVIICCLLFVICCFFINRICLYL